LFLLSASFAYSQPVDAKVEFEITSIKPSPKQTGVVRVGCTGGPGQPDPGMLRCQNMSLANLIARAYNLIPYQFTAPDWMQSQLFDITAKVPEGATKEQFALMLQNMLIDRFNLKAHHESREMTKYELVVAKKGPNLKESQDDPAPKDGDIYPPPPPAPSARSAVDSEGYPVLAPGRQGMMIMNGRARLFYPKWTIEQLARQLAGQLGKPVTDSTGLKGKYDIGLYWSTDTMRAKTPGADGALGPIPDNGSGPTLERAIQDQLGLRLESTKGPVDLLVVDHIEKRPTEN
jgi:uncharacterized protein (TIGR03435 family)